MPFREVRGSQAALKVFSQPTSRSIDSSCGTKDILGHILDSRTGGRFRITDLVGAGRDHPDRRRKLVGGVSQRMVLAAGHLT